MHRKTLILSILTANCIISTLSQTCEDLQIPVEINEHDEDTRYILGCSITNSSFPDEEVRLINIDCSSSDVKLKELPENFINNFENVNEFLIKCFVKNIKPRAFSNLPAAKDVDLSGNELTQIYEGVFNSIPRLLYLNLSYNAISTIADLAFANMPHLSELDLSYNRLDHLKRSWFENTLNIDEFHINNNRLKEIPANMFRGWTNAYAYTFDYNQISQIEDGAFTDVATEINSLSLHHNSLTSINLKAFGERNYVLQFDVSSNLLNYLPHEFFKKVTVKKLWIFGNPLECTCLRNLDVFLASKRVKIVDFELKSKSLRDEECDKFDAPVCGISSLKVCRQCKDLVLTSRMMKSVEEAGFRDLHDWYEVCALLSSRKEYLDI